MGRGRAKMAVPRSPDPWLRLRWNQKSVFTLTELKLYYSLRMVFSSNLNSLSRRRAIMDESDDHGRVGRSVRHPKSFSWNWNPKKRFIQTFLKALGPYGRRIWCKMYVIGSSTDEWQSYGAESTNQKSGFWFFQMLKQKTQSEFERKTIVTGMDSFSWVYFPPSPVSLCRWPWPMKNSLGMAIFGPIRIHFKRKKKYWTRILTQPLLKLKKSKLKRMIINKMWFRWF